MLSVFFLLNLGVKIDEMSAIKKKNTLRVTTYSKVILLLVSTSIGFGILFLVLYFYTNKVQNQFFVQSQENYSDQIKAQLDLYSENYYSTITDITYWDEFVNFTKTKDIKWFNTSIASVLQTAKVDYLVVYDKNQEFITKVSSPKFTLNVSIPDHEFNYLKKKNLSKFYLRINNQIIEIYGSTIHPSDDPFKNKTSLQGYFFMGKLVDKSYFSNLEKLSDSKISFNSNFKNQESNYLVHQLKDNKGTVVSNILFQKPLMVDFKTTKTVLWIIVGAFFLIIFLYHYYAKQWAGKPIKLIKKVLEESDLGAIRSLKKIHGEFRYIGKLFEQNYNQKMLLKSAKEKAEESDNLKSAFLTNLSHEIRTPMNAIMGFTELLHNKELSIEEKENYLEIINKSGAELVGIIEELVEMSKIDTNQVKVNSISVSIEEFFGDLSKSSEAIVHKNSKIKFLSNRLTLPSNYRIFIDDTKLKQVVLNLVKNATKFTDGGIIELNYSINELQKKIEISLKDTGIGIPKDQQIVIFDRFRKIESDYTIKAGGLGLGLSIAKAYVDMMGGEIHLQSEEDIGSTFTVIIPLIKDVSIIRTNYFEKPLNQITTNNSLITILIAEDDNINFLLIDKMLKMKNYKVIRAIDGEDAVDKCKKLNNIDLILMDLKMPKMNGYQAFDKIKSFRPKLPIIAQTAFSSIEDFDKINKTGFDGYITKPLKKDALLELVEKVLS